MGIAAVGWLQFVAVACGLSNSSVQKDEKKLNILAAKVKLVPRNPVFLISSKQSKEV